MDNAKRTGLTGDLKRWLGCCLVLVMMVPVLAACGDDDDGDPTATPEDAGAATVEVEATPTEPGEPTAAVPTGSEATATPTTEPVTAAADEPTVAETAAEPTPTTGEAAMPGNLPVDQQLSWLLDVLNAGTAPAAEEVEPRLHPSFSAQLPPEQFATQLGQLAQSGPWEFTGYLGDPVGLDGIGLISGPPGQLQVIVGLEVPEPHRFMTLLLVPYSEPMLSFASFDEIDSWLMNQAPEVSFQVAEITDDTCQPLHAVNAENSLAVASAFKLWILLELADRIAAGEASWDDGLTLQDELKSLPSGTLQVEEAGLNIALSTYAAKMMVLSDNTATDHLIDFLGREAIEERVAATGNMAMDLNTPLLHTRELFYLKVVASAEERDEYIAADDARQREILNDLTIDFTQADPNALNMPIAIDSIEWFASAADLCAVSRELYVAGQSDETLRSIMAASSGINVDSETWPYVAFKGGNEAGVASGAWLLERSDGRVFAITVAANNPDAGVDPVQLDALATAVANLLAGIE